MTTERRAREARGRWAESIAAWSLRLRGFRVVARRYRTPVGELDLVARHGRLLTFVEVKARPHRDQALDALTEGQCQRTARAAQLSLQRHPSYAGCTMRFDLVAICPWRLPFHLNDAWRQQT